jgi:hypothetical protein
VLYSKDEAFCDLLEQFYVSRAKFITPLLLPPQSIWTIYKAAVDDGSPYSAEYLKSLKALAEEVGLNRLRDGARESSQLPDLSHGTLLIHRWCQARASSEQKGEPFRPQAFSMVEYSAGPDPDIFDEGSDLPIALTVNSSWNPKTETPADAKTRIINEASKVVRREISSAHKYVESLGFEFEPASNTVRDVQWLFWHVRDNLSYLQIANQSGLVDNKDPRETVRTAVRRIALMVGIQPESII